MTALGRPHGAHPPSDTSYSTTRRPRLRDSHRCDRRAQWHSDHCRHSDARGTSVTVEAGKLYYVRRGYHDEVRGSGWGLPGASRSIFPCLAYSPLAPMLSICHSDNSIYVNKPSCQSPNVIRELHGQCILTVAYPAFTHYILWNHDRHLDGGATVTSRLRRREFAGSVKQCHAVT